MWGVIRVKGIANIKEVCDVLAWDMTSSGLQVHWKEHQSAESSAHVLLMNIHLALKQGSVESKIIWHLTEIEKKFLKRGTIPTKYFGVPLPKIKVTWQRNGRCKAERDLSLNNLGQPFQQNR
jgi:hypothetical protein